MQKLSKYGFNKESPMCLITVAWNLQLRFDKTRYMSYLMYQYSRIQRTLTVVQVPFDIIMLPFPQKSNA